MINRTPEQYADAAFDLAVVGAGVLGACHALEAARRGLRVLLLERDDFGGATSWSSHRLVHGGLRYVQTLDFPRQTESIRERRWFLRSFPTCAEPLPCLMPLYNRGMKRTSTLRAAFAINDLISLRRNAGVAEANHLGRGRVIGAEETRRIFPQVDGRGLRGAALWHDGLMSPPQRVLMEIIRWSVSLGAKALNYVQVRRIQRTDTQELALHSEDRVTARDPVFRARHVINCAGPWAAEVDAHAERAPALTLAFSLALDRPALASAAVAVAGRQSGGPMWFVLPLQGRMLAGTCHLPWTAGTSRLQPGAEQIDRFLASLNEAVSGLGACRDQVVRVFSGLLPASRAGSEHPSNRVTRREHPDSQPGSRWMTVWGIKYTTARSAAEKTLRGMFPELRPVDAAPPPPVQGHDFRRWRAPSAEERPQFHELLRRLVDEEAVTCLDDLLMRRTDWGIFPDAAAEARELILEDFPQLEAV